MAIKSTALQASMQRGNPTDDIKSVVGGIYTDLKRLLNLTTCGNNTYSFLRDTIAPLVTRDTVVYAELKYDVLG